MAEGGERPGFVKRAGSYVAGAISEAYTAIFKESGKPDPLDPEQSEKKFHKVTRVPLAPPQNVSDISLVPGTPEQRKNAQDKHPAAQVITPKIYDQDEAELPPGVTLLKPRDRDPNLPPKPPTRPRPHRPSGPPTRPAA